MKIRTGFVSNSSSSSFIVLLPDDFTKEDLDFSKAKYMDEDETSEESIFKAFEQLKREKFIDEYGCEGETMSALEDMLGDFVITKVETGPDRDSMELVNIERVKKILGV